MLPFIKKYALHRVLLGPNKREYSGCVPDFLSASTVISGSPQIRCSSSCHVIKVRTALGTTFSSPLRIAFTWKRRFLMKEIKMNWDVNNNRGYHKRYLTYHTECEKNLLRKIFKHKMNNYAFHIVNGEKGSNAVMIMLFCLYLFTQLISIFTRCFNNVLSKPNTSVWQAFSWQGTTFQPGRRYVLSPRYSFLSQIEVTFTLRELIFAERIFAMRGIDFIIILRKKFSWLTPVFYRNSLFFLEIFEIFLTKTYFAELTFAINIKNVKINFRENQFPRTLRYLKVTYLFLISWRRRHFDYFSSQK